MLNIVSFSPDGEFLFFLIKKALKRIKNQKNQAENTQDLY